MNGKYVKLIKLSVSEGAQCPTLKKEDWVSGQSNNGSPFVGYTLEGYLLGEIEIGKRIRVDRRVRNGEKVQGLFESSTVLAFDKDATGKVVVTTRNSKYSIEYGADNE